MKPGIKSTEFWIMLVVTIAGLVTAALPETHVAVKIAGLVVSVAGSLGYTVARGGVKKAEVAAKNGDAG